MDVLPLYVDPDRPQLDVDKPRSPPTQRGKLPPAEPNAEIEPDPHAVLGRHRYRVPESQRISFGTYFNGFAASYWRRWTVVDAVTLHVTRHRRRPRASSSTARCPTAARSASTPRSTIGRRAPRSSRFDLPLAPFGDGGWYWFDVDRRPRGRRPRGGHAGSPTSPRTGPGPAP